MGDIGPELAIGDQASRISRVQLLQPGLVFLQIDAGKYKSAEAASGLARNAQCGAKLRCAHTEAIRRVDELAGCLALQLRQATGMIEIARIKICLQRREENWLTAAD